MLEPRTITVGQGYLTVNWTFEPARKRTCFVKPNLHSFLQLEWPAVAFAHAHANYGYQCLSMFVMPDENVDELRRSIWVNTICLGPSAAAMVREGKITAPEAFWRTSFSSNTLAHIAEKGPAGVQSSNSYPPLTIQSASEWLVRAHPFNLTY